jgi:arginase family enzyme
MTLTLWTRHSLRALGLPRWADRRRGRRWGLRGLDVVGADLVEVSPPFDASGGTAWLGISLMFEMLCVMAERVARG